MNVSASVCRFAAKEKSLKNGNEKKSFREKKVLGAGSGIIHGGADVEPDQLFLRPKWHNVRVSEIDYVFSVSARANCAALEQMTR